MVVNSRERDRIGVAIPAGKHINPVIEGMLRQQGFSFDWRQNGGLHASVRNSPVDLTVQNHRDIIGQVAEGHFVAGFVGSDLLAEYMVSRSEKGLPKVESVESFGLFSPTIRLSLLVRRGNNVNDKPYRRVEELHGKRVITTYPELSNLFFLQHIKDEEMMPNIDGTVTGKEEGQLAARLAEAAVVIVDKGTAMNANRLRELAVVMRDIKPVLLVNNDFLNEHGDTGRLRAWEQFMDRLKNGCNVNMGSLLPLNSAVGESGTVGSQPLVV